MAISEMNEHVIIVPIVSPPFVFFWAAQFPS